MSSTSSRASNNSTPSPKSSTLATSSSASSSSPLTSSSPSSKTPATQPATQRPSVSDFFDKFQKAIHIGQKTQESRFAAREEDWRRWANPGRGLGTPVGRRAEANQFEVPRRPWENEGEEEEEEE